MKIAVLSSFTTSLFWFRIDMMKSFKESGYDVLAVGDAEESEWGPKFNKMGIRYKQIPVQRNGTNPFKDLKTLIALNKLLKDEKPDKIFAYQAKTVVYGGIAAQINHIKDFYPLIAGIGSVFLGTGFKATVIKFVLVTEYRIGLRNAPVVFFQNQDDLSVFVENKILKRDCAVILNGSGVNTSKFVPANLPEKFTFLCISRLIFDKGVGEYLNACRIIRKRHPAVRCMLVGPFDSNPSAITEDYLQDYIDDGSVEYFGEQKDVVPFLHDCTVFVLPSYHEGTPKTVLEAMACGRSVITTDAPGCRETVTDGDNGYLIPVKNVDALVDAMEKLIADEDTTKAMGIRGREIAESKYDVRLVNSKIKRTMKM